MIIKRLDLAALPSSQTRRGGVLPDFPVVYIIFNQSTVFYVGATESLFNRLKGHCNDGRPRLKRALNSRETRVAWIKLPVEQLGEAEYALIQFFNPRFNFCKHRGNTYNPRVAENAKRGSRPRYARLEEPPKPVNGNGHQ